MEFIRPSTPPTAPSEPQFSGLVIGSKWSAAYLECDDKNKREWKKGGEK